jgi:hypothetical protein
MRYPRLQIHHGFSIGNSSRRHWQPARSTKQGLPQLAKAAKRGVAAVRANARQFAVNVLPIIEEIERAGITSHNAIAAKLNERNVQTARGGKWTHVQVGAVLRPFEQSAAVAVV